MGSNEEVKTMTAQDTKELQIREKQEVSTPAEQTRPGLVFTPSVDIFETDKELVLLADMPGVTAENLNIDLRDDTLTLAGEVRSIQSPEESEIMIEYAMGKYYRQFSLSEIIDQTKIDAQLEDGVLRLTLPKVEKATPRRIAVQSV
jgi:HSP20 family protein